MGIILKFRCCLELFPSLFRPPFCFLSLCFWFRDEIFFLIIYCHFRSWVVTVCLTWLYTWYGEWEFRRQGSRRWQDSRVRFHLMQTDIPEMFQIKTRGSHVFKILYNTFLNPAKIPFKIIQKLIRSKLQNLPAT